MSCDDDDSCEHYPEEEDEFSGGSSKTGDSGAVSNFDIAISAVTIMASMLI